MSKRGRDEGSPPCKVARLEEGQLFEAVASTSKSAELTGATYSLKEKKWPSWNKTPHTRASGGAALLVNSHYEDGTFQLIDEVTGDDDDEDENDEIDSSESDSYSYDSDVPEEEIDALLEEGLPEEMKGPRKRRRETNQEEDDGDVQHPPHYEEREKMVLVEKGANHFEILPEGWVQVTHNSGIPVYLHRPSRVCTMSKPYFLGQGSVRKHDIPVSAIPCLQYLRALIEEVSAAQNKTTRAEKTTNDTQDSEFQSERSAAQNHDANPQVKKLFVRGIKYDMTKDDLKEVFSQFGKVLSAHIPIDKATGKSRSYGFIEYDDPDCVDKACLWPLITVKDREVTVKKALDQDPQSNKPMQIDGRVLPPPKLLMRGEVEPRQGVWESRDQYFYEGVNLKEWAVINYDSYIQKDALMNFLGNLQRMGKERGMNIEWPTTIQNSHQQNPEREFLQLKEKHSNLQMIMVVLDKESNLYGRVKCTGNGELRIVTQCVLGQNVQNNAQATVSSIVLKINEKMGITNNVLGQSSQPIVSSEQVSNITAPTDNDISDASIAACQSSIEPPPPGPTPPQYSASPPPPLPSDPPLPDSPAPVPSPPPPVPSSPPADSDDPALPTENPPLPTDAPPLPLPADVPPLPLPTDAPPLPLPTDTPPLPLPTDAPPLPLLTDAPPLPSPPTDAPPLPSPPTDTPPFPSSPTDTPPCPSSPYNPEDVSACPMGHGLHSLKEQIRNESAANDVNSATPPPGLMVGNAKIETAVENLQRQSLTADELREYCQRRFSFKTLKIIRFQTWAERRKYQKAMKKKDRPQLPEGTKLISLRRRDEDSGSPNSHKKEWIMNPKGKSYVCILHEYVQHALKKQPRYVFKEVENASTPYAATIIINEMHYCTGYGSSKKVAKVEAAKATLEILLPELGRKIREETNTRVDDDLSFFDEIRIEDPNVPELCNKTSELTPYSILLNCLQRNFGLSGANIESKLVTQKNQKNEFIMSVGKHTVQVQCKNKKDGKQRASQAILQKLHPHIQSWGSLLRLYGNRSMQSMREKKAEEQEITLLQSNATLNQPNTSIINKLKHEMLKLHVMKKSIQPIGKFQPPENTLLPSSSGIDLNNVDL